MGVSQSLVTIPVLPYRIGKQNLRTPFNELTGHGDKGVSIPPTIGKGSVDNSRQNPVNRFTGVVSHSRVPVPNHSTSP